ncbi:MAG: GNAT family N-acetyltransferase [Candidatus Cloacimonetes bacterium]|nr:GNAT family N-acetyltransferase [Candidatus Cloacimonadota bacterium]
MKMIELKKEDYNNVKLHYRYISDKYYKVIYTQTNNGWNIQFKLTQSENKIIKDYEEPLIEDWMEEESENGCQIFGIEDDGNIVAWLTIGKESWSDRLRIYELLVHEDHRKKGYGKLLVQKAKEIAKEKRCYCVILETQTNNYNAIEFYKKYGFKLFGCDLNCYQYNDIKRNEVRIDMVCYLTQVSQVADGTEFRVNLK